MKLKMKLSIDQESIDIGIRGSVSFCPIACKMKDTVLPDGLGKVIGASVGDDSALFVVEDKDGVRRRLRFHMPVRAYRFIRRFDRFGKHAVEPFSFFAVINDGEM